MLDAAFLDRCPRCEALDVTLREGRLTCRGCGLVVEHAALAVCPDCGAVVLPDAACARCAADDASDEDAARPRRALGTVVAVLLVGAFGLLGFAAWLADGKARGIAGVVALTLRVALASLAIAFVGRSSYVARRRRRKLLDDVFR